MSSVLVIPPIHESVDLNERLPSMSERYFTHFYYVPKNHLKKFHSTDDEYGGDLKLADDDVRNCISVDENQTKKTKLDVENSDEEVSSRCKKIKLDDGTETVSVSLENGNSVSMASSTNSENISSTCQKININPLDDTSKRTPNSDEGDVNEPNVSEKGEVNALDKTSEHQPNSEEGEVNPLNKTSEHKPRSADGNDSGESSEPKYDWARMECHITLEETLVMLHSNKLCVVSLSKYHPVVRGRKTVVKVEYDAQVLASKVSGKKKRGAVVLGSKTTLCRIFTACGRVYTVPCGARGKLVQINENLLASPDLSRSHFGREGFLAVVMPRLEDIPALVEMLPSAEAYDELVERCAANLLAM